MPGIAPTGYAAAAAGTPAHTAPQADGHAAGAHACVHAAIGGHAAGYAAGMPREQLLAAVPQPGGQPRISGMKDGKSGADAIGMPAAGRVCGKRKRSNSDAASVMPMCVPAIAGAAGDAGRPTLGAAKGSNLGTAAAGTPPLPGGRLPASMLLASAPPCPCSTEDLGASICAGGASASSASLSLEE